MYSKLVLAALIGSSLVSLPAVAQTTRPAETAPMTTQAPAAKTSLYEMKAGQWRASKMEGLAVYNNDERIGDVSELILAKDGKIEAVVIGVGGFLGMGEHLVAVPYEQVRWVEEPRTAATRTSGTTGTTGSGTSAPVTNIDRPAATTTVERSNNTTTTTTTTTDRPAVTTTERPAGTAAAPARDAYRGYPDHAVVAMTKEQLKALPEVRYSR